MKLNVTPQGTYQGTCVVNGPIQTNTYVLISGTEALLIDPAWDGKALVDVVSSHFPEVTLVGVVCTHGHADHVGGVAGVRKALPNIAYYLPADDVDIPASNIAEQRAWGIDTPYPGEPTQLVHEGDEIRCGSIVLQAIATPGHTPGGMVYFTATESGNIAFVGDTLFPGSHGRTDLTGGNEEAIKTSLKKLAALLPADTLCYVGHGPSTTIERELASNPYMHG